MTAPPATAQANLREAVAAVAQDVVATRAAQYDEAYELPLASLSALHDLGLLALCVPERLGGGGVNVLEGVRPAEYVEVIEELGRADMATSHCFQVHSHSCMLLSTVADVPLLERVLEPVVQGGGLLSWTGSEAGRTASGQFNISATASRTDGGFLLNGVKNFATLASAAAWNIIAVTLADQKPGPDAFMLVMVPAGATGLTIDADWWRPMGMRATVSPILRLENLFVPDADVLLAPGEYPRLARLEFGWKLHLSFAANFVGAAQGLVDFAVAYLPSTGRAVTSQITEPLGRATARINAARELLHAAVRALEADDPRGPNLAIQARYVAIDAATAAVPDIIELVGSRALFESFPLERQIRDIHVQSTHSRQSVLSETIGARTLGTGHDLSRQV